MTLQPLVRTQTDCRKCDVDRHSPLIPVLTRLGPWRRNPRINTMFIKFEALSIPCKPRSSYFSFRLTPFLPFPPLVCKAEVFYSSFLHVISNLRCSSNLIVWKCTIVHEHKNCKEWIHVMYNNKISCWSAKKEDKFDIFLENLKKLARNTSSPIPIDKQLTMWFNGWSSAVKCG